MLPIDTITSSIFFFHNLLSNADLAYVFDMDEEYINKLLSFAHDGVTTAIICLCNGLIKN